MTKTKTRSGAVPRDDARLQQRWSVIRRSQVRYTQAGRRTPQHGRSR